MKIHCFALVTFVLCATFDLAAAVPDSLSCPLITVYVSETCPHCRDAKAYLSVFNESEPGLGITYRDVSRDPLARTAFSRLNKQHAIERPGVPTFDICGRIIVGFDEATLRSALYGNLASEQPASADVPLFGNIRPDDLGLPLFTIVLGLVDGFNPCAMWVLLFLLSILVNVKRRNRILMVAGTFVVVSGLVYFVFMAAWLNVFLIIGFSRAVQIALGSIAILVGSVHVKDFFALHRGITLSIPEAVKPQLYDRIRRVVRAENLPVALGGTIILAILVNFVEVLCTAGFPALYTQILTSYSLNQATYYGYLALYNLAYIADDGMMVAIAVVTLGHRRLQDREARWLKLLSGVFIVTLGAILIISPDIFSF